MKDKTGVGLCLISVLNWLLPARDEERYALDLTYLFYSELQLVFGSPAEKFCHAGDCRKTGKGCTNFGLHREDTLTQFICTLLIMGVTNLMLLCIHLFPKQLNQIHL